jgi:hypothetical protein
MALYGMAKEQRPSTGPTARMPVTFHCTAGQMIGFMYTAMAIGDVTVKSIPCCGELGTAKCNRETCSMHRVQQTSDGYN